MSGFVTAITCHSLVLHPSYIEKNGSQFILQSIRDCLFLTNSYLFKRDYELSARAFLLCFLLNIFLNPKENFLDEF